MDFKIDESKLQRREFVHSTGRKRKHTKEFCAELLRLSDEGYTHRSIGEAVDPQLSEGTVAWLINRYKREQA